MTKYWLTSWSRGHVASESFGSGRILSIVSVYLSPLQFTPSHTLLCVLALLSVFHSACATVPQFFTLTRSIYYFFGRPTKFNTGNCTIFYSPLSSPHFTVSSHITTMTNCTLVTCFISTFSLTSKTSVDEVEPNSSHHVMFLMVTW